MHSLALPQNGRNVKVQDALSNQSDVVSANLARYPSGQALKLQVQSAR